MTLLNSHDDEKPIINNSIRQKNRGLQGVTADLALNQDGSPKVPLPEKSNILFHIVRFVLMYGIVQIILLSFILRSLYKEKISIQDVKAIYSTVNAAHSRPVTKHSAYQNSILLSRLWKLPSAKIYISSGALEYQRREGFCGRTTLRCLLKSFSIPHSALPGE